MQRISTKVWNRIEMLRQPIAAELPGGDNRRHWVAIYPARSTTLTPNPHHLYTVLYTEFDVAGLVEQEPYGDEDLAITQQMRYYANSEDELYSLLSKLKVDPQLFDAPWQVQYPL